MPPISHLRDSFPPEGGKPNGGAAPLKRGRLSWFQFLKVTVMVAEVEVTLSKEISKFTFLPSLRV